MSDSIIKAFEYGIDYGLLLAEQERDSEDMYDACQCSIYAKKMCRPSSLGQRRSARSNKWREAKQKSVIKFIELCKDNSTPEWKEREKAYKLAIQALEKQLQEETNTSGKETQNIISWFEKCLSDIKGECCYANYAYRKAIEALKKQLQEEPNEPLTLDELKQMDGEPVYIIPITLHKWIGDPLDGKPGWGLLRTSWVRIWRNETADLTHSDFDFEDYGKIWLAYRRKKDVE